MIIECNSPLTSYALTILWLFGMLCGLMVAGFVAIGGPLLWKILK